MSSVGCLRALSHCWMTAADMADEVRLKRQLAAHAVHLAMVAHWFEDRERRHDSDAIATDNVVNFDVARCLRALSKT